MCAGQPCSAFNYVEQTGTCELGSALGLSPVNPSTSSAALTKVYADAHASGEEVTPLKMKLHNANARSTSSIYITHSEEKFGGRPDQRLK